MSHSHSNTTGTRLAIVTATLNRHDLLRRLHESLRNQTVAMDWIHVVIDDCSDTQPQLPTAWPDNTHLLYQRNEQRRGPLISRNIALDLALNANALLIAFVDDDDYVTRDFFSSINAVWRDHPEVGWYINRCQYVGQNTPANQMWPERDGLFDYARDLQLYPKFTSDVLHIVSAARLGDRRFSRYGMYQREWTLLSKLARDGAFYASSKCIVVREYLDQGLTQTSRTRAPDFIGAVNYVQKAAVLLSLAPLSGRAWLRFLRQSAAVPVRLARLLMASASKAHR